jgi:hypothetical protein
MEDNCLMNNPNIYGYGCSISANGIGFEPELFLSQTIFPPDVITAYGKLGMPEGLKGKVGEEDLLLYETLYKSTFLILKVSKSGINAIQHKEAILFLKQYRNEISRLSKFPRIEQINLRCVVADGELYEEEHPYELLILARDCGISLVA